MTVNTNPEMEIARKEFEDIYGATMQLSVWHPEEARYTIMSETEHAWDSFIAGRNKGLEIAREMCIQRAASYANSAGLQQYTVLNFLSGDLAKKRLVRKNTFARTYKRNNSLTEN